LALNRKKLPLFDLESRELIFGPPDEILTYEDFEPYQRWMSKLCINLKYVYLGADMGLGKTATALKAASVWLKKGKCRKILIIAPLNVANHTWPDEIAKWDFARPMKYSVITGTEEQRLWALNRDAEVYIINRENVVWLYKHLNPHETPEELENPNWPFDGLIYDEASRLKGGAKKTKQTVRKDGTLSAKNVSEFGALRRIRPKFKRIVQLSGTPAPNGLIDLWGPFYLLDKGSRLGSSKDAFLKRWFSYDKWTYKWEPHEHAKKDILDRLKDIFFTLRSEDYLTLPELKIVDRWVHLTEKQKRQYDDFKAEMVLEEHDIEAVNNGVLCNKLLQFANGHVYNEEQEAIKIHDQKLKELESIVEESAGKPILLAYSYAFDRDAIKKKFPWARIFGEKESDMRDWNEGKIRMLITHPASAGHGLNFQFGSNIAVWYGLNWSLELYQQFIKRLHRRGQKEGTVFMYRILARGTFDEHQVETLKQKGVTQDDIIDAGTAEIGETPWPIAA